MKSQSIFDKRNLKLLVNLKNEKLASYKEDFKVFNI